MKLRILGDSLRLRLSQSDVRALSEQGRVQEIIRFGSRALTYALQASDEVTRPAATYEGDLVTVSLPRDAAQRWVQSDQVGIEAEQALPGGDTLRILVEKDFKCVVPRAGEEDYDGFPHPDASC